MSLTFPWSNGLKMEELEQEWDETTFPDGGGEFFDYVHKETGTKIYKAQHPEFELWSQGIHARAGVSCADCHMPYEKQGATKVSSHWVRSPKVSMPIKKQLESWANRSTMVAKHKPQRCR